MNTALEKSLGGQVLLVVCCILYLLWWSISYRPGTSVNRAGGWNGILLLLTASSGIAGVLLSVYGMNELPKVEPSKMNGMVIVSVGIAAYFALLLLTGVLMRRPVTTELFLITAWAVLEFTMVNSLNAAGNLSDARFWIMIAVLAAAFFISMVLYVLYYRMEPLRAFYSAMVPLITEGAAMAVLLILVLSGSR